MESEHQSFFGDFRPVFVVRDFVHCVLDLFFPKENPVFLVFEMMIYVGFVDFL
jgi:hypothetical protein